MAITSCGPTDFGDDGVHDDNVGDGDGDDGDGQTCDQVIPIEATPGAPPDLLVVLDKSGSMGLSLEDGDNKWETMKVALSDLVTDHETGIHFGLLPFPQGAACVAGDVTSEVSSQNGAAMVTALAAITPNGGTPTHTTLAAAAAYFEQAPANPAGRYILLATDGLPNCNPNAQQPSIEESIVAIDSLLSDGIVSFVVGFGGDVNNEPLTLDRMAAAGGTDAAFSANSAQELGEALEAITGQLSDTICSVSLDKPPSSIELLAVFFDGIAVARSPSHANGWDLDSTGLEIRFYGETCDQLRDGDVAQIRIEDGCGGPVID